METNVLYETIMFDEKDLYINFDQWIRQKNKNILFITGLSGSGKTTLAKELSSKYNADIFELDGLEGNYDSSKTNFLLKYKKLNPELKKSLENRDFLKLSDEDKLKEYNKFFNWLVKEMHNDPDKLYIVEGMVIYQLKETSLEHSSVIIKGSSALTSIIRRLQRGYGHSLTPKIIFDEIFKFKLNMEKNIIKDNKLLNQFKNNIHKKGE